MTEAQGWRARQAGYNQTGVTYSGGNYGTRIGRAYLRSRTERLVHEVERRLGRDAEPDVLEIGCGTGLTLESLALSTRWRLHGIDFSSTMLREAAKRSADTGHPAVLALGNAIELPFADASFDVVYATRFIHQFPHEDKLRIAGEIARVLRPGGVAGLEFYARALNHLRYYTTQRGKYATRELYFSHYPSRAEVAEIVGEDERIHALRFVGDRWINRLFGYRSYAAAESLVSRVPGLRLLMSEHWVFYSPAPAASASGAARGDGARGLAKLRCPTCRGPLAHDAARALLACAPCGRGYEVDDGLPNLLAHESRPLA
jgi:SAM-dependent methyltransferase/uncharacterized protein YbaR (Trm112 family)